MGDHWVGLPVGVGAEVGHRVGEGGGEEEEGVEQKALKEEEELGIVEVLVGEEGEVGGQAAAGVVKSQRGHQQAQGVAWILTPLPPPLPR